MAAEGLACKKERAFVILSVNSNTGIELEGNGLELDLAGRAHACCTLPKILDQRPDTAAVLGEKRAEIVLLGNCEIEARNDDIHNRIFAIATIDTEIDLDRLLTLGRMRIDENRADEFVARRSLDRTGYLQCLSAVFLEFSAIHREGIFLE